MEEYLNGIQGVRGSNPLSSTNVFNNLQTEIARRSGCVLEIGSILVPKNTGDTNNDIDSSVLRGSCTREQLIEEAQGCNEQAIIVTEDSLIKPSVFSVSVEAGEYTLVILNFGLGSDTASYRLEVSVD